MSKETTSTCVPGCLILASRSPIGASYASKPTGFNQRTRTSEDATFFVVVGLKYFALYAFRLSQFNKNEARRKTIRQRASNGRNMQRVLFRVSARSRLRHKPVVLTSLLARDVAVSN